MLRFVKKRIPARAKVNLQQSFWRMVDLFDFFYRYLSAQSFLPPYSLRMYIGGSKGFKEGGPFFANQFSQKNLLKQQTSILDVGCGCGRVAYTFATDNKFASKIEQYHGMDIDKRCIDWCQTNISKANNKFQFYRPDLKNIFYNPKGKYETKDYAFPHKDKQFDLIFLTSVFTHLMDNEVRNFCKEFFRMLRPGGRVYATFFTYNSQQEAALPTEKRHIVFPHYFGNYALANVDLPEAAVAYQQDYLRGLLTECGFEIISIEYMLQNVYLLKKINE